MNQATLVACFIVLFIGVAMAISPRLGRRGFLFGWTVAPGFSQGLTGVRLQRRYLAIVLSATAMGLVITFVNARRIGVAILLMLAVHVAALRWARSQAAAYRVEPERRREASLATRNSRLVGGWAAWLLPMTLPLASMALNDLHWARIAERVPIHYGVDGRADRWVAKSWWSVNAPALIGLSVGLTLLLMAWNLAHARRTSAQGDAAASESSRLRFSMSVMLGVMYLLNGLFFVLNLRTLDLVSEFPPLAMVTVFSLCMVVLLAACWRYAQRRQAMEPPVDGTPDECWHLGIFYANSNDPAILVEQRMGFGYTLKFGRPAAWLILLLAVGPGVAMSFLR